MPTKAKLGQGGTSRRRLPHAQGGAAKLRPVAKHHEGRGQRLAAGKSRPRSRRRREERGHLGPRQRPVPRLRPKLVRHGDKGVQSAGNKREHDRKARRGLEDGSGGSQGRDVAGEGRQGGESDHSPRRSRSDGTGPSVPGGLAVKAPAPKKVIEGYSKDERFLTSQRAALLKERSTYLEQAASLKAEAESLVEEMEPGDIQFDDESGEGGTVTVDRERDLALSAQALAAVEEIDHTLAKMDNGTYGICENCGRLIPKARLEALPYARLCIDCKSGGLSRR